MIKNLTLISFLLMMPVAVYAQEGGRQIRLDSNTCKSILPEYTRKKSNSLYAKALAAEKTGKANDMQKARIREVEFLRGALKAAKCKGIS